MTNKPGQASQRTNKLRGELTYGWQDCAYLCARRML